MRRSIALVVLCSCAHKSPPPVVQAPTDPYRESCATLRVQLDVYTARMFLEVIEGYTPDGLEEAARREMQADYALLCKLP
jgi:hypothetical protein